MKKLLALALAATLLLALFACGKPAASNPPLELGEKYLFDMDYEQALLQFDQAIVIEPKNPRGYLGKYATLEFMNRHDEAVQTLRDGQAQAGGTVLGAILDAAEFSMEEGIAAAAKAYERLGLKNLAYKLLRLCVKVFETTERFAAALDEVQEKLIAEALDAHATSIGVTDTEEPKELSQFISDDGDGFTASRLEISDLFGYKGGIGDKWESHSFTIRFATYEGKLQNVYWNTDWFSIYGIRVGDSRVVAQNKLTTLGFSEVDGRDGWLGRYFCYDETRDLSITFAYDYNYSTKTEGTDITAIHVCVGVDDGKW